jgi:hypothetical protein
MQSKEEVSSKYVSPQAEVVEVAGAAMCDSIGVTNGMATQKDPTTGTGGTLPTSSTSEANGNIHGGGIAGSDFG